MAPHIIRRTHFYFLFPQRKFLKQSQFDSFEKRFYFPTHVSYAESQASLRHNLYHLIAFWKHLMKVLTIEYELSIELLQVIDWYCYMYMQEFISIQETPEEILLHTKSILNLYIFLPNRTKCGISC